MNEHLNEDLKVMTNVQKNLATPSLVRLPDLEEYYKQYSILQFQDMFIGCELANAPVFKVNDLSYQCTSCRLFRVPMKDFKYTYESVKECVQQFICCNESNEKIVYIYQAFIIKSHIFNDNIDSLTDAIEIVIRYATVSVYDVIKQKASEDAERFMKHIQEKPLKIPVGSIREYVWEKIQHNGPRRMIYYLVL